MKKKTMLLLLVLAGGAAAAIIYLRGVRKQETIIWNTVKPQFGYIASSVTATGNVQPDDTVSVGAQVSGVVKNIFADFNSKVKQGQLIAKIDPSIIMAQVDQAKATLVSAQSNLDYQKNNFERQSQLFKLGAISQAEYQVALNQYNSARASVDNASAQLKLSKRNLYYTNIYSPINGIVLNRNVNAGQTIASSFNAPTLFVIARDLTRMQVDADVDEADIGHVKTRQNATFTVDAFPDDIFNGTVKDIYLHPSVSANVVTYRTLIDVENNEMKLKPGMTASITIFTEEDSNALLIPMKALNFKPDSSLLKNYKIIAAQNDTVNDEHTNSAGNYHSRDSLNRSIHENKKIHKSHVWIKQGNTLIEKRILTGINDGAWVKVIRGLSTTDDVIVSAGAKANMQASQNTPKSPFMPQMRRPSTNRRS